MAGQRAAAAQAGRGPGWTLTLTLLFQNITCCLSASRQGPRLHAAQVVAYLPVYDVR